MRAHQCCRGGWCSCPFFWPGHADPLHQNGVLVHQCGVTVHPEFITQPVAEAVDGPLKLSIITASYKRQEELERCIRAVQAQSYRNLEHVIVSDGPDPNTEQMVGRLDAEFMEGIPIRYYATGRRWSAHDQDKGGTPFFVGTALCSGDIAALLPDDDELLPTFAEHVVKAFERGTDGYEPNCLVIDDVGGGQTQMRDIVCVRTELMWWTEASPEFDKGKAMAAWKRCWPKMKWAYGDDVDVIRHVQPSGTPESRSID